MNLNLKTNHLISLLVAALVIALVARQSPVSAFLAAGTDTPTFTPAPSSTATATKTVQPQAPTSAATSTATNTTASTPTKTNTSAPANTATSAPTQTAAASTATATKTTQPAGPTSTPTVTGTVGTAAPTASATSTLKPTVKPTATVTPSKSAATPTKTATTKAAASSKAPRAGVMSSISTSYVVQNLDSSITASLTADVYGPAGIPPVETISQSVSPNRSVTIDQRTDGVLSSGFQGSVVLNSNTLIAAVVNQFGGNAGSLGMDFRFDNYNAFQSSAASTSVLLPQLLKNVYDSGQNKTYNSLIAIQNTNLASAASVSITYYNTISGNVTHSGISIPPGASNSIDLQTEGVIPLPGGASNYYLGPGVVTSTQPVAVLVNQSAAGALLDYQGFTSADSATTLYFPQVLYNIYDSIQNYTYGTGIMVMTANQSSANVTVTYTTSTGGTFSTTRTASPSAIFDQRFDVPAAGYGSMYGSVSISSSTPIVALLNMVTNFNSSTGARMLTSRAFPTGSGKTQLFIPQLLRNVTDGNSGVNWSTGFQAVLMGSGSGTVTATYYLSNGATAIESKTVSTSNPIAVFDQRYSSVFPNGLSASAVINSTVPIAITVNMVGDSSAPGDALGNYPGQ